MVSKVAKQIECYENIGKMSAIGGSLTVVAYAMLGRDYTYPCTIAVLGACTWLHIWFNKSTQEEALQSDSDKSLKDRLKAHVNGAIDAVADDAKKKLKGGSDRFVNTHVTTSKVAVLSCLPNGAGTLIAPSLEAVGESAKGVSHKSIDCTVDCSKKSAKGCVGISFDGSKNSRSSSSCFRPS
jgi:hypothetical protein